MKKEQEALARLIQLEQDRTFKEIDIIKVEAKNKIKEIEEEKFSCQQLFEQEKVDIDNAVEFLNKYLLDLKEKQQNTLKIIKEEEKLKNEINFYRLTLDPKDIDDIEKLRSIEQYIHNKDVLRKLIYKTYIEVPMLSLFGRVGIKDCAGIYKITNINNNMAYIGQSTNIKNRVKAHIQASIGISTIASQLVHDKMSEEGLEYFTFQVLEECDKSLLSNREKYWIDYYSTNEYGYNRTVGGARS